MKKALCVVAAILTSTALFAEGRFSPVGISIEHVKGGQTAQYPSADDSVYGWRLTFVSSAHHGMVGLATAVFANTDAAVSGSVGGLQVASLFNTAGSGELGVWQLSGFCNMVTDSANGFQACAFYNEVTRGYFVGMQTALANKASVEFYGVQTGLYNDGDSVTGMQIGLVNRTHSLGGAQLGLLNFVKESAMDMFPIIRIGW